MRAFVRTSLATVACLLGACAGRSRPMATTAPAMSPASGTIAQVYYWRAKAGKFDEYTRYVRDVAEPIDHEAQRNGAFLSVTTFMTRDTTSLWTHMRVFVLRDSAQLAGLSGALDAATTKLEPDSVKRRLRGEYSAGLRESAGRATAIILP